MATSSKKGTRRTKKSSAQLPLEPNERSRNKASRVPRGGLEHPLDNALNELLDEVKKIGRSVVSTKAVAPEHEESFKKMSEKLMKEWWPKDRNGLKNPRALTNAEFDLFENNVKGIMPLVASWPNFASWLKALANSWQSWDSNAPVPSDDRDWDAVKGAARAAIAAGVPRAPGAANVELDVFDQIAARK